MAAAAAAGHGFFYPSMWGNSHGSGSFTNTNGSSNGPNTSSNSVSNIPNMSPTSTSNTKENRDNNSYDPPHASPPVSASSSSPYGYPSSPPKCDVKSVHDIKSEHNFSHQRETSENFKNNQPRKSLGGAEEVEYDNRRGESPTGEFSPTNNNNQFDSEKDDMPNTHNSAEGVYENTNRHPNYHYHPHDSNTSAYSGHSIPIAGNTSSGHLIKRPEGTNRSNTNEKGENRDNECGTYSPIPENQPPSPSAYNSSSISSTGGAYPYLSSTHHQSNAHQATNLSSPLYGSYSTCGSLFASSKSFHNSSSSSKSKSLKGKPNSSGKKKICLSLANFPYSGGCFFELLHSYPFQD